MKALLPNAPFNVALVREQVLAEMSSHEDDGRGEELFGRLLQALEGIVPEAPSTLFYCTGPAPAEPLYLVIPRAQENLVVLVGYVPRQRVPLRTIEHLLIVFFDHFCPSLARKKLEPLPAEDERALRAAVAFPVVSMPKA